MENEEVLKSIIVQGTLLDSDTTMYTDILQEINTKKDYNDPVSKAISTAFNLCSEGVIDPWDIDIGAFTKIFSSMIDEDFDEFGLAGYLISQAWHILLEKSEKSVQSRISEENDEDPVTEEITVEFGEEVAPNFVNLYEPVKHTEKRQVFLVELLDAMKVAYKKTQKKRPEAAQKNKVQLSIMEDIIFELHAEEPEKEIEEVLRKIMSMERSVFSIEEVWGYTIEDHASFLVYCLFLVREKKIRLRQDAPYKDIYVEKLDF